MNIGEDQPVEEADGGHSRRKIIRLEGKTIMILPLLIILTALLLWTLIPDPDLETQPVNKRRR